ncbi:MAG: hypothetical protein ABI456_25395, partial [Ktedonobacteraceae bacterium]
MGEIATTGRSSPGIPRVRLQGAGQRRPYTKQGIAAREDLSERAEPGISCRGAAGLRPAPTTRGMPDDAPPDL